jgi:hypothetical protein
MRRSLRAAVTSAVACFVIACFVIACADRTAERADSAAAPPAIPVEPDVAQACEAIAALFMKSGTTLVSVTNDSFPELIGGGALEGCVVQARGTLGGGVTVPYLARALPDSLGPGWTRDSTRVADSPRGTAYALSRGSTRCLFRIHWTMRVRYDTKADPPPYTASVGCAPIRGRESVP